jgi:uncharacterized membrane protein
MPGDNNSQNQPNATTFSQNPNIADKHMQFAGQTRPQAPVAGQPAQPVQLAIPQNRPQPQPFTQPGQPIQQQPQPYLNPNNFKQVLGEQGQPSTPQPQQPVTANGPITPMPISYPNATQQAHAKPVSTAKVNSSDTFKLIIYVVPLIAVFILAMKSIDDKETMWHVRQSLLMQGIWFGVLIIIKLVELPIISDYGLNLWNIICYILLILAGIQAYNNERYHIPIVYEIGEKFIEG